MLRTGWALGLQLMDRPGMEIAAILTHRKEEQKRVKEQFLIYTFLDYTCYIYILIYVIECYRYVYWMITCWNNPTIYWDNPTTDS